MNSQTGEALRGCCKATNLCECARHRYVRETTRVLVNDSASSPPSIFVVLTAREFLRKDDSLKATFKQLLKAARRRWPECEWFVRWEDQARGALHANLLVKGVPADEYDELRAVLVSVWCARVDADPKGQYAEPCDDGEAVASYVARKVSHAGKRDQEPELERGKHRTSQTRGYFDRPMAELRAEARRQLRHEALVWRGHSDELAEHELSIAATVEWKYVAPSNGRDPDAERAAAARRPFGRVLGRGRSSEGARTPPVASTAAAKSATSEISP